MTFEEKVQKVLEKRTIALTSKKGALQSKEDLQDERDFNNNYLFGTPGNEGIVNFFESYYRELNFGLGRTTSAPALQGGIGTSSSAYQSRFQNAVDLNGDDSTGFYPPDGNGIGAQDLNYSSIWFTTNGDQGQTTGGAVGNALSATSAASSLYDRRQLDLTGGPPPGYGPDGSPDEPDYFNNPHRNNLLTALSNTINSLTSYKSQLDITIGILTKVDDDLNILVNEVDGKDDYPLTDIAVMEAFKIVIQGYIDSFQNEYDYFSSFSASDDISGQSGYNRSTFNNKLTSTIPTLKNNLQSSLNSRETQVKSALSYNNISSGIRKWLTFWIAENINKPVSPYYSLSGIDNAISSAQKSINQANSALEILFDDPTQYLSTPTSLAAYFNPELDKDGILISNRVTYLWLGTMVANKYKIFRKEISNAALLNNNNWTDSDLLTWVTEVNPDNGAIRIEYTDETVSPEIIYSYRVQTFDSNEGPVSDLDRVDSFNSSSLQSPVYEEDGFSIIDLSEKTITFSEKHSFRKGELVFISNQGIYLIESVSEDTIEIETPLIGIIGETAHKTFGLIKF